MTAREKLAEWIKERGLKKHFVAQQLGVYHVTLSFWLNGHRKPDLKSAVKIEAMTGISAREWVE